jgi:hypothetical protein
MKWQIEGDITYRRAGPRRSQGGDTDEPPKSPHLTHLPPSALSPPLGVAAGQSPVVVGGGGPPSLARVGLRLVQLGALVVALLAAK